MVLGVNTFLFTSPFTTDKLDLLDTIASIGFDGVEIALENPGDIDPAAVRRRLQELGLRCCAVCGVFGAGRDLRGDDYDQRGAKEFIRQGMGIAEELECNLFAGPLYSRTGRAGPESHDSRREQWKRVAGHLGDLSHEASNRGIQLAIEVMNRFATDFLNTCDQALELIGEINSPALGVHLDTFHMNIEEKSMAAAISTAGNRLFHFHAADNDRSAPGKGAIDWHSIKNSLEQVGYDGSIVIESFMPDIRIGGTVPSVWRRLAPDGQTLAREGLAFLQDLFGR
ncbi:MAG: sugar phosphate isomerase/epimerase [Alkalispirochaeta sp.]